MTSEEQFDNFLFQWEKYYQTINTIPEKDHKTAKRVVYQQEDELMDKLNDEQKEVLDDFKDFIYTSNKKIE